MLKLRIISCLVFLKVYNISPLVTSKGEGSQQQGWNSSPSAGPVPSMQNSIVVLCFLFNPSLLPPPSPQEYSKLGDRRSDGRHITLSQSDKWLKQARVVDGRGLTTVDTAITWSRMASSHDMSFPEWLHYVEEITEVSHAPKDFLKVNSFDTANC